MGNGPFIDGLPIKNGGSFHGYVSHNQRVIVFQQRHLKTSSFWGVQWILLLPGDYTSPSGFHLLGYKYARSCPV